MTIEKLKELLDRKGYDYHEQVERGVTSADYHMMVYAVSRSGSFECQRIGVKKLLLASGEGFFEQNEAYRRL